nr:MAG TPA: hypothetical protein [Caudoviricetes sp.]
MTRCFKKHLVSSDAASACKVHRVNKFGKELLGTRPLAVSFYLIKALFLSDCGKRSRFCLPCKHTIAH